MFAVSFSLEFLGDVIIFSGHKSVFDKEGGILLPAHLSGLIDHLLQFLNPLGIALAVRQ